MYLFLKLAAFDELESFGFVESDCVECLHNFEYNF